MPIPAALGSRLRLPALAAPMFLASGPDLVVETCRSGVLGTFPALNQRTTAGFGDWLDEIEGRLAPVPDAAPFGVNLIVHASNPRLQADLALVVARRVPVVVTSLGAVSEVVAAIHSYGGLVLHDVVSRRHGEKAAEAGVDGIIAVAAGAGGHAGTLSPFALLAELRQVFPNGALILAGAINTGAQVLAARAMGADLVSIGTRFLASREAQVSEGQKAMMVAARAGDVVHTAAVSGVPANFLRQSLESNGIDPTTLPQHRLDLSGEAKAWKTIWSAGHGVGGLGDVPGAADLCERLIAEYRAAKAALARDPF